MNFGQTGLGQHAGGDQDFHVTLLDFSQVVRNGFEFSLKGGGIGLQT